MERLDMCRRKAHKLVAVGSALRSLKVVDHAFASGQLTWSKVALLCRVATEDTEREWVLKARDLGYRQLEWLVRSCAPGDRPPTEAAGGLPRVKFHVQAELGALDYEVWEQAKRKLAEERGTAVGDAELMTELSRMLLSTREDGSIPGRRPVDDSCFQVVVDVGTRTVQTEDGPVPLSGSDVECVVSDASPKLTKKQRRRVLTRDGQRCRCCRSQRSLQVHHIRFVSQGGESVAENLLTLCSYCHGRIHEGLLRIRSGPSGGVEFQDRHGRKLQGRLTAARSTPDYVLRSGEVLRPDLRANGHGDLPTNGHGDLPTNGHGDQPVNQDVVDRDFVLQNMDRLRWRGGRMVLA
jgi:hypothetical protein